MKSIILNLRLRNSCIKYLAPRKNSFILTSWSSFIKVFLRAYTIDRCFSSICFPNQITILRKAERSNKVLPQGSQVFCYVQKKNYQFHNTNYIVIRVYMYLRLERETKLKHIPFCPFLRSQLRKLENNISNASASTRNTWSNNNTLVGNIQTSKQDDFTWFPFYCYLWSPWNAVGQ